LIPDSTIAPTANEKRGPRWQIQVLEQEVTVLNPGSTGQRKAIEILWFFFYLPSPPPVAHNCAWLHFDLYAAWFSPSQSWEIYIVTALSKGLDKVTVAAGIAQGISAN